MSWMILITFLFIVELLIGKSTNGHFVACGIWFATVVIFFAKNMKITKTALIDWLIFAALLTIIMYIIWLHGNVWSQPSNFGLMK